MVVQEGAYFIPVTQYPAEREEGRGHGVLSMATEQVSDKSRPLTKQADTVFSAAEKTVSSDGSAIGNCSYFTKSALWLFNMLDRTSKSNVYLGNAKARNPNSRKQK